MMKKNVPWHILAPRRGCFSNHLPLRRVRILVELFLSYGNKVSYTIKKDDTGSSDRNRPLLLRKHCLLTCPYQYFHRLQPLYTVNP